MIKTTVPILVLFPVEMTNNKRRHETGFGKDMVKAKSNDFQKYVRDTKD